MDIGFSNSVKEFIFMEEHINRFRCGDIKIVFLLFSLFFSFNSCASLPKYMRNAFTYCHNEKDTGIESLINIDGYYIIFYPGTGFWKGSDSYMFYKNGLFTMNLPGEYDSVKKQYDISLGLQETAENPNGEKAKRFYNKIWGSYIVCGDIIKIQYVDKPFPLSSTYGGEEWFKVIDRNTLISINSMPLSTDKSDWQNYEHEYYKSIRDEKRKYRAVFMPVPVKPNPDEAWILKEKWFWCNEQGWKNFMQKIEQKKIKKK